MRTLIKEVQLISPADGINEVCDLLIKDNLIEQLASHISAPDAACATVAGKGLFALPGLIDIGCNLLKPGYEYKAAVATETRAILSAGVTTTCCMPGIDPVVSSPATIKLMQQRTDDDQAPNLFIVGPLSKGLRGESLSEMFALKQAGCIAVTNHLRPFVNTGILKRALKYAAKLDLLVMLYPFDHALAGEGCMHEGIVSTKLGLSGIPISAETASLAQYLALVEDTGARVHFCRLSCARSVEIIAQARKAGLPITSDVSVNHLFLTEEDVLGFNPNCNVLPPFRTKEDREALREGLCSGVIDSVCSDHQPHYTNAKLAPFPSVEPGISAIETLLSLMLELAEQNIIPIERAISALSCSSARVLNIRSGRLCEGEIADICLVDPKQDWTLKTDVMLSSGKNTPFAGRSFQGKVRQVFINGKQVYKNAS